MFDTHCHLNFKRFKGRVEEVISTAHEAGVEEIVVPGTDIESSRKAIEVAQAHENIYAACGIHPHHVYEYQEHTTWNITKILGDLEQLLRGEKVVAVGEVGMDRHVYENTKYAQYTIDESFIQKQKELFRNQIHLAIHYKKSLIIHNREAKDDVTGILRELWDPFLSGRSVFHCSEPDKELLVFAKSHGMYWGVDGDVTYWKEKQEFLKRVPIEMLVLETDAPFLLPEPMKSRKEYPNEPKYIPRIAQEVARIKNVSIEEISEKTSMNARKLFNLD